MGRWPGWIRLSPAESRHLQFLSIIRIIFARSLLVPEIAGDDIYHYSLSSLAAAVLRLPPPFHIPRTPCEVTRIQGKNPAGHTPYLHTACICC